MINVTWQPGMTLEETEREIIMNSLKFYLWNKSKAARSLGITTRTIFNKLESYGMSEYVREQAIKMKVKDEDDIFEASESKSEDFRPYREGDSGAL